MIIGIEAQRIFRQHKHGMDIVALEIIKRIPDFDSANTYYVYVRSDSDNCIESKGNILIKTISSRNFGWWEQVLLCRRVKKDKCNILHCTSNTAPIFTKIPIILTLHDIIFLEKSILQIIKSKGTWYQRLGNIYRKLIVPIIIKKRNISIITVSESEKEKICKKFNIPSEKITVVYNAAGNHFKPLDVESVNDFRRIKGLPDNFLLFHGNTDPKKNLDGMLNAYSLYRKKSSSPKDLVITEISKEYLNQQLNKIQAEWLKPFIHITGYIPNSQIHLLYNSSFLFLYPSLREGFGIPILEAQACGKPVITSNCYSMPEVSGNAALLVDPNNYNDVADAIIKLDSDEILYKRLVEAGFINCKRFSWEKSTHQTINEYSETLKSK